MQIFPKEGYAIKFSREEAQRLTENYERITGTSDDISKSAFLRRLMQLAFERINSQDTPPPSDGALAQLEAENKDLHLKLEQLTQQLTEVNNQGSYPAPDEIILKGVGEKERRFLVALADHQGTDYKGLLINNTLLPLFSSLDPQKLNQDTIRRVQLPAAEKKIYHDTFRKGE